MKFLFSIVLVFMMCSCSGSSGGEEVQPEDTEKPIMAIASPLNNGTFC